MRETWEHPEIALTLLDVACAELRALKSEAETAKRRHRARPGDAPARWLPAHAHRVEGAARVVLALCRALDLEHPDLTWEGPA